MKHLLAMLSLSILFAATLVAQEVNKRVMDGKFVAVASALIGATMVDVEGTFAVKNSLKGNKEFYFHERNPLMRPFISAGKPATYAILGGMDAGVLTLAWKLKKSKHSVIQRIWWVPPVAMAVSHAFAGTANFRLSRLR